MWLPLVLPFVDTEGNHHDLMAVFLDTEYAAFPVARHDDMLDGLARLDEPTLKLQYPKAAAIDTYVDYIPLDAELNY